MVTYRLETILELANLTSNPNNNNMYPDYHQNMGDPNKFSQYTQNDGTPNMDYGKNNSFNPMYGDISPPVNGKESNVPKNYFSDEMTTTPLVFQTYDSLDQRKDTTTGSKETLDSLEGKHAKVKRHKKKKKKMLEDLFADDKSHESKAKSDSHMKPKSSFEDPFKNSNHEGHTEKDFQSKELNSGASQFDNLSKDKLVQDKNKIDELLKARYSDSSLFTDTSTTSKPGFWKKLSNGGSWLYNMVTGVPKLKDLFVKDFKYYITDLDDS
uniref:Uncharacterized protein n=1 Tax=Cacopsylla melanoneura TaxID=428564 RepID=A0A8D8YV15_9HEMI